MKSRICTICARGGSKGVPGKNTRVLNGKPLLAWSVLQAKKSGLFNVIAVSSDSDEILAAGLAAGATHAVKRPADLASDTAGKLPAIVHAVQDVEAQLGKRFETVVDLDATSPLRQVADILGSVALLENGQAPNVITGCKARRSPYFNLVEALPDGSVQLAKKTNPPVLRRQDAPACFDMNASIYVWKREVLDQPQAVLIPGTKLFEMPEERSIDVDTALDFEWLQWIAEKTQAWKDLE